MHRSHRLVTATPIAELWTDHERLVARRVRALTRDQLVALLQDAPVRFVIADVGHALRWVPIEECFVTWKQDVRPHLVDDPAQPLDHTASRDGWAYVASEWEDDDVAAPPIVVLERHH